MAHTYLFLISKVYITFNGYLQAAYIKWYKISIKNSNKNRPLKSSHVESYQNLDNANGLKEQMHIISVWIGFLKQKQFK